MRWSLLAIPDLPLPPVPSDPADQRRQQHSRLRRRMLYGLWRQDLIERLTQQIGTIRREAWGEPDLSSCVASSAVTAIATQYDRGVCIEHPDGESVEPLLEEIEATGLWSLKQRYQRDLLGMREMAMAIDVTATDISYRPVFPDMMTATSTPYRPQTPTMISEAILTERGAWVYERWTADGCRIIDANSREVVETRAPWVYSDGRGFIPYVLDHAARCGALWDAYDQIELWDGSLSAAVLWTYFGHVMRDSSWPQRWLLGAEVAGLQTEGTAAGNRQAVVTDPAVVLLLKQIEDYAGQAQVGQWSAAADPAVILAACDAYERRVAARAGISPGDIQRMADPRSGYAIAITREAQREMQRRFAPVLMPGDLELIAKTAAMVNRVRGTSYPESGYRITYESIPASSDEIAEGRAQSDWEESKGLSSPVSVYMRLHPGVEADEAADKIVEMRLEAMALEARVAAEAAALGLGPKAPPPPKPQPEEPIPAPGVINE